MHVLIEAVRELRDRVDAQVFGSLDTFPDYAVTLRAAADGLPVSFRGAFEPGRVREIIPRSTCSRCHQCGSRTHRWSFTRRSWPACPSWRRASGGIPDLIQDGMNGLLFEPASGPSLAAAIRRLLDDPRCWRGSGASDAGQVHCRQRDRMGRFLSRGRSGLVSTPRVSVVIPTKNGAKTLPALLDSLWRVPERFPIEIVAIDSGSTDGTIELLRPRVQKLLDVPAGSFNHGLTRNAAIAASPGELLVLNVQDAAPTSPGRLQANGAPLDQDPRVAGAFARQQPRSAQRHHALVRRTLDCGRRGAARRVDSGCGRIRSARAHGTAADVRVRQRVLVHPPVRVGTIRSERRPSPRISWALEVRVPAIASHACRMRS